MIEKLTIDNFRGLEHVELTSLGRVNLLVGRNSAGKTSVLEALYLLEEPYTTGTLRKLLVNRAYEMYRNGASRSHDSLVNLSGGSLFTLLKTQGASGTVKVTAETGDDQWSYELRLERGRLYAKASSRLDKDLEEENWVNDLNGEFGFNLSRRDKRWPAVWFEIAEISEAEIAEEVGEMTLERADRWLVDKMQSVDPRVRGIQFLPVDRRNQPCVDLGGPRLMPLSQVGDGLRYATALFAKLRLLKETIVLIDEVERRLHHESMVAVWKALRTIAHEQDLQIFATTHSYDCLQAADKAFADAPDDLKLLRLQRLDGKLWVIDYPAEVRHHALEDGSEVR